ncbi:bacteriocin [Helicobacter sp. UBA3407]|uniref:bacteriocin n=2 Tax=Helicobacter TaxID=209 RepID=UPI0026263B30|nr:bacteriocin [Helicobacter sp. UBA3407]
MKKLILGTLLSLGLTSTLFAGEVDFIALATNGEFNEQSAGVKVLNEEEMKQVVGGAISYARTERKYGLYTNNYYLITEAIGSSLYNDYIKAINPNTESLYLVHRYQLKYSWSYSGQYQKSWLEVRDKNTNKLLRQPFISKFTKTYAYTK